MNTNYQYWLGKINLICFAKANSGWSTVTTCLCVGFNKLTAISIMSGECLMVAASWAWSINKSIREKIPTSNWFLFSNDELYEDHVIFSDLSHLWVKNTFFNHVSLSFMKICILKVKSGTGGSGGVGCLAKVDVLTLV